MKDNRHLHPLNDPEHQRTCIRCRAMDLIGNEVRAANERVKEQLGVAPEDEHWFTFFIIAAANIYAAGDGPPPPEVKAAFLREVEALFDATMAGDGEN